METKPVHLKFDTTPGAKKPFYFITDDMPFHKELSVPGLTFNQAMLVKDVMKAANITVIDHTR